MILKAILFLSFRTYSLYSGLPSVHPSSFFNQFENKQLKIAFILNWQRKERQKSSLTYLDLFIFCNFFSFFFRNTAKRTVINIEKRNHATIANKKGNILVFPTFCIKFVSFGLMIFFAISCFVFFQQLRSNS